MSVNFQTYADEALGAAIDCTEMEINYIDRPDMTNSERLEAMDRAFFESVNRFEFCNLSSQSSSSSESASSANQASGAGSETAMSGSEAAMGDTEISEADLDSVANSLMTGTEAESTSPLSDAHEDSHLPEDASENAGDEAVVIYGGSGASGALPEDIPDADNDDVVAAQIRLAAEIEKDPVKKGKLWNEYRKYKGLLVKYNEE